MYSVKYIHCIKFPIRLNKLNLFVSIIMIELDSGLVFWARLKGFPDWPARMCSLAEGDALRKKMQAQPPAKDSIAVSFLGIKCEKYVCMHACIYVCMYVCIPCNMYSYPVAVSMYAQYICMYVCM